MRWADTMVIPAGAEQRAPTRGVDELRLRPGERRPHRGLRRLQPAGRRRAGVPSSATRSSTALADEPADVPATRTLWPAARSSPTSTSEDEATFDERFAEITGLVEPARWRGGRRRRGPAQARGRLRALRAAQPRRPLAAPLLPRAAWSRCAARRCRKPSRFMPNDLEFTWEFSNYTDAISRLLRAVHPVVHVRGHRHAALHRSSATRWPTSSRSAAAATGTCCSGSWWSRSSPRS